MPDINLEAYKKQQNALLPEYNGKIIAWHEGRLQGVYESKTEAMQDMERRFEPGSFLIIKCLPGDGEYVRRFRSRVILPPSNRDVTAFSQ